jgi:hypothetical protein
MRKPSFMATDSYLAMVNEILAGDISAEGAYCLGLVSAMAEIDGLGAPQRIVLELAAQCRRMADAADVFEQWRELRTKGAANADKK